MVWWEEAAAAAAWRDECRDSRWGWLVTPGSEPPLTTSPPCLPPFKTLLPATALVPSARGSAGTSRAPSWDPPLSPQDVPWGCGVPRVGLGGVGWGVGGCVHGIGVKGEVPRAGGLCKDRMCSPPSPHTPPTCRVQTGPPAASALAPMIQVVPTRGQLGPEQPGPAHPQTGGGARGVEGGLEDRVARCLGARLHRDGAALPQGVCTLLPPPTPHPTITWPPLSSTPPPHTCVTSLWWGAMYFCR